MTGFISVILLYLFVFAHKKFFKLFHCSIFAAPAPAIFGYSLVPRAVDGTLQWSMVHIRGFQTAGISKLYEN